MHHTRSACSIGFCLVYRRGSRKRCGDSTWEVRRSVRAIDNNVYVACRPDCGVMLTTVAIDIFAQYISTLKCSWIPHTLLKGINDRWTSADGENDRFKQFSFVCFNLRVEYRRTWPLFVLTLSLVMHGCRLLGIVWQFSASKTCIHSRAEL